MYVELQCRSHFSFLHGGSAPDALVAQAVELGLEQLALTDLGGLYGAAQFHRAASQAGLRVIIGSSVDLPEGGLTLLAMDGDGYSALSQLLTRAQHRRPDKGEHLASWADLGEFGDRLIAVAGGEGSLIGASAQEVLRRLKDLFGDRLFAAVQRHMSPSSRERARRTLELAERVGVAAVATNDVLYATAADRELVDVLACVRDKTTLAAAGRRLAMNAERRLKGHGEMAVLFADRPDLIARSAEIASRCRDPLSSSRYTLPDFPDLPSEVHDEDAYLERLCRRGSEQRYDTVTPEVEAQLRHELRIVGLLGLAGYFLIVWDIVRFCRREGICCQGRGSAANSILCYALGITPIDPIANKLLFERFLTLERSDPPDIDLDIAHRHRERVIQYVYGRYGRDHVAMICNVITYRRRLAIREVAKVLGAKAEQVDELARTAGRWDDPDRLEALCDSPTLRPLPRLVARLVGTPRHLGIHPGGMILSRRPLAEVIPIEPASMVGRTVVQWDKDDCADMGIVKVDLLGLGILTLIQDAFDMVGAEIGHRPSLADLSPDDPAVYDLICAADTVGVFQVESRAQMGTLPKTQPRTFYELAVQVAIIRPGPIQGGMVNPYLRRRQGLEAVTYLHPLLEPILERTCGVPLFQEQVMKIAIEVAGFSGSQADTLRRAMGHKRSAAKMEGLIEELMDGMARAGVSGDAAGEILAQLTAFAGYGFPESHAMAFAFLVYASAWLKHRHPLIFVTALLNAQPMGCYSPDTIVRDARRHGVEVLPICARHSGFDATIEEGALRLGLRLVRGVGRDSERGLTAARAEAPFESLLDFCRRSGLSKEGLIGLAKVDGFRAFGWDRRDATWQVEAMHTAAETPLLGSPRIARGHLPSMSVAEEVFADYACAGLTVNHTPLDAFGPARHTIDYVRVSELRSHRHGEHLAVFGLVLSRHAPPTANGVVFVLLEDETGLVNVVVMPNLRQIYQRVLETASFIRASGRLETARGGVNILASHLEWLRP